MQNDKDALGMMMHNILAEFIKGSTQFLNYKTTEERLDISIVRQAILNIHITFDNLEWIISQALNYNEDGIIIEILRKIQTYNMLVKDVDPR